MYPKLKYTIVILVVSLFSKLIAGEKICLSGYLFDEVIITGGTNLNSFQLWYNEDNYTEFQSDSVAADQLQINVPTNKIRAESHLMLKDFLDLIQADKHPDIFISMNEPQGEFVKGKQFMHKINLTMNGIQKTYNCVSEIKSCDFDVLCLVGQMDILLTDFGVRPPRKFFGLIKVKNEVFISFRVLFLTRKKKTKIEI